MIVYKRLDRVVANYVLEGKVKSLNHKYIPSERMFKRISLILKKWEYYGKL